MAKTDYRNAEWYALHGYDEYGRPRQRFTWEGIATACPPGFSDMAEGHIHIWLRDNHRPQRRPSLPAVLTCYPDDTMYKLKIHRETVNDFAAKTITDRSTPYTDAVKMAYAMFMITGGTND